MLSFSLQLMLSGLCFMQAKKIASENDDLVGCCSADIALGRAHIGRNDWAAADAVLSSARKMLTTTVQLDGSMV